MTTSLAQRIASLSPEKRALLERRRREQSTPEARGLRIPQRQGDGPWPASTDQAALWFFHQLEPGNPAYNIGNGFRLRGRLHVPTLERALNAMARRHESLRTTFEAQDGRPYQVIHDAIHLEIPVTDLRHEANPEATALAEVGRIIRLPFDLERGPLLRLPLLRIADEDWVLIGVLHHIITDWWSYNLFFTELFTTYTAFHHGRDDPFPPLPVQFADYAQWRDAWERSEDYARQESYWMQQLDGMPTVLEIPADRPRPPMQSFRGAREFFTIPRRNTLAYKAMNRQANASSAMTLMALTFVTLWRVAGRRDLVMGQPVSADREYEDTRRLIGYLLNTLLFRVRLDPHKSFRDLLDQVRRVCLEGFQNKDLPFRTLVNRLGAERDMSRMPLYQFEFLHVTTDSPLPEDGISTDLPDLTDFDVEFFAIDRQTSPVDMQFAFTEGPVDTGFLIEYNTDVFDPPTVRRVGDLLLVLMDRLLASPDDPLAQIPLMDDATQRRILGPWSRAKESETEQKPLHRFVTERAAANPGAIAVRTVSGQSLTYGDLDRRSAGLAWALRNRGMGTEDVVAVSLERTPELLVAVLGILRAGACYLPLDPTLPEERRRFFLEDAEAVAVVGSGEAWGRPVIELREAAEAEAPFDDEPTSLDQAAYRIYTSGSTGTPKAVVVSHASASQLVDWAQGAFSAEELAQVVAATSLSFDVSVFELFGTLAAGGTVLLLDDLLALAELLAEAEPTLLSAVPGALESVLDTTSLPTSVRTVCVAGEALGNAFAERLRGLPGVERVVNLYGPTEGTVYALGWDVPREPQGPVLIGRPLATTRSYVLDRRLRTLPIGVPGELHLGGGGVARGYAGRPALTAASFVPDPFSPRPGSRLYKTGDRVRFLTDQGEVQFLGRGDGQVKLRGFRIELGEIENALRGVESVGDAAVALRGTGGEAFLAAYLAPTDGDLEAEALTDAAREALAQQLPAYMVPTTFTVLDDLPRLTSGKIHRQALPDPGRPTAKELDRTPPSTPHEQLLAEIWEEVLETPTAGVHNHFFELGGHSLKATQVVARLRQRAQLEVPVRVLFEAPTIAGLARRLDVLEASRDTAPIEPLPADAKLPLSFAQQRLWFLDQLEGQGEGTYNMPTGLYLEGHLDHRALYRTLAHIVARHDTLRSSFPTVDGEPRVHLASPQDLHYLGVDLLALPEEHREPEARRLVAREARRTFDLARGPLFRAFLVRFGERRHALLLAMHHIISDGWSIGVLVKELSSLYESFSQRARPRLAELPVQYADFAAWQRSWLTEERQAEQIQYWRERLAGAPKRLELPVDRPRPAFQTFNGATRSWNLDASINRALEPTAQAAGATPFMVLLASFATLLGRLAGQRDVVLGTPVAGRERHEVEDLIGFFVNTVVARVELEPESGFDSLLPRVRQGVLDDFARQDVPFERLVEELAPERDRSQSPLFQVLFTLQNVPMGELRLPGLRLAPLELSSASSKFDISLYLHQVEGGLWGTFEYNTDLFDGTTMDRLGRSWRSLLAGIAADPSRPLSRLPLLTAGERHHLVHEWNDTEASLGHEPVHVLIARRAAEDPGRLAVESEDGATSLTYGELVERAGQLAGRLAELGIGPEDRVAVCLGRSPSMIPVLLGLFEAGAAYVPLDPSHPLKRRTYMLNDSRARLLIADPEHQELGETAGIPVMGPEETGTASGALPAADGERLAYVLYTSGSTGAPKGVQIRHRALLHELENFAEAPGMTSDDLVLALATLAFDIHTIEIFLPLMLGARVLVSGSDTARDGARLRRLLEDRQPSVVQATPATWQLLLGAGWQGPPVRALCGGEALPRELAEEILGTGSTLWNIYGPTETTVWSSRQRVTAEEVTGPLVSIGRPLDNMTFHLLDRHLEPVPLGVPGELHIGGVGVDRGYLGRARLTAAAFVPAPDGLPPVRAGARVYKTGDLARRRADGRLDFLGRRDHQVKVRGFRIELGEIEAALLEHPSVHHAAVVVRRDEQGDRLVAWLVPEADACTDGLADTLRRALGETLPAHMVPAVFVPLEALPLNPNRKVDRGVLSKQELPSDAAGAAEGPRGIAPRDDLELRLALHFATLLDRKDLRVDDDFFALGGHSLLAVRLMDRLNQEFGRELPVSVLFENPTVEALATHLRRSSADGETPPWSPLVTVRPGNDSPALYLVHPAGGQVLCFLDLARGLNDPRPVRGFQALGLVAGQEPLTSVEALAELYLGELRKDQPQGPYYLGGYSLGGHVVYEMARRLREDGEEIALLVVIDIYPEEAYTTPEATRPADDAELYSQVLAAQGVELSAEELRTLGEEERLERTLEVARAHGMIPPDLRTEEAGRYFRLFQTNAQLRFNPPTTDLDLVLMHAAEHPGGPMPQLIEGWRQRVGNLKTIPLPGDHEGLVYPPHVETLAQAFDQLLSNTEGKS